MRRLLLSLAFALSAPPAFAQGTEEEPQAAPGSIAIGMIEQVDGDGIFDLVHDGAVTVRHTRSGLICRFLRNGDGGRLIIFNPPTDPAHSAEITIPRGDDVACEMEEGGAHIRYFATRYPFGSTLDEQIAGVEAAIRGRNANATRYPGESTRNTEDGLPLRRTTRFIITQQGVRTYTRASVARVGDWILKLRYSAPAPDDAAAAHADQAADRLFDGALDEIINPRTQ
ncbi:MAG: hypothetical protein IPG56_05805 [Caulobacteraceae bacterium]|nr:hypothetical protein [Caulobacteraceae bacterium]